MPSAIAMQASLADWMMTPCIRSSRRTLEFKTAYMVDPPEAAPPCRQAFSLIVNSSLR